MDDATVGEVTTNVFQLGLLDLVFQVLDLFVNVVTGVLMPGMLSLVFQTIFGFFQTAP